jgi:hypothetical protein
LEEPRGRDRQRRRLLVFGDGLVYLGNRFMEFSAAGAAPRGHDQQRPRRVDVDSVLFGMSLYPPGRMLSAPLRGARAGVEVAEETAGLGDTASICSMTWVRERRRVVVRSMRRIARDRSGSTPHRSACVRDRAKAAVG